MSLAEFLSPLDEIVEDAKKGRMFILIDDESRENEGDLVIPAQHCTAETINFMAKHGRGLICLALSRQRVEQLGLPLMAHGNESRMQTAFTVSIEAREGITTGISAADRARTIQVAIDPKATRADLATPGHIFPLLARDGGVLVRAGHTEAAVDIARLAGLNPSGVVCEIMNDDGTMARVPDLTRFCAEHGLKMLTVAELIRYRLQNERYIFRVAESMLPTPYGEFRVIAYESEVNGGESHLALVKGDVSTGDDPVLVRVHSHCLAGDVFAGSICDCHHLVQQSLRQIAEAGRGALVYLHNTSRGFDIDRSVQPHRILFHREARPHEDDRHQRILRQVGLGGQILADLGIHKIRLLSNTPTHVPALQGFNVEIVEQVPILGDPVKTRR